MQRGNQPAMESLDGGMKKALAGGSERGGFRYPGPNLSGMMKGEGMFRVQGLGSEFVWNDKGRGNAEGRARSEMRCWLCRWHAHDATIPLAHQWLLHPLETPKRGLMVTMSNELRRISARDVGPWPGALAGSGGCSSNSMLEDMVLSSPLRSHGSAM